MQYVSVAVRVGSNEQITMSLPFVFDLFLMIKIEVLVPDCTGAWW
jgi:hypothetical protein